MHPVVLILPDGYSIEQMRRGESGVTDPVRTLCDARGWDCMDAKEAFLAQPAERESASWFVNSFHYSVEGNRIVADWIGRELDRRGW